MDEVAILWVVIYGAIGGLVAFCILYAVLARPWNDYMGRHLLAFNTGLALAFIYAALGRLIPKEIRTQGWILVLGIFAGLAWWRVVILLQYQYRARRAAKRAKEIIEENRSE